jgi:hypothetical protein
VISVVHADEPQNRNIHRVTTEPRRRVDVPRTTRRR